MSSFTHWPALRMYPGSQTHPSEQGPVHWFGGNGLQEGWQIGAHESKWLLGGHFRAGEEECVLVLIINFTLSHSMRDMIWEIIQTLMSAGFVRVYGWVICIFQTYDRRCCFSRVQLWRHGPDIRWRTTLLLHTMQNELHPVHTHQTNSLGRNPIHTGLICVSICYLVKMIH